MQKWLNIKLLLSRDRRIREKLESTSIGLFCKRPPLLSMAFSLIFPEECINVMLYPYKSKRFYLYTKGNHLLRGTLNWSLFIWQYHITWFNVKHRFKEMNWFFYKIFRNIMRQIYYVIGYTEACCKNYDLLHLGVVRHG